MAGHEGVVADPVHDLHRVVLPVVAVRAPEVRVLRHLGLARPGGPAAVDVEVERDLVALARHVLTGAQRGHGHAVLREPAAGELHGRLVGQDAELLLVVHHVVRSEPRAARVRHLPAVVGAAGAVERAAAHHLPVPRVVAGVVGERVVVVVGQPAQVAELVREHAQPRALRLCGDPAARVRPVVGRRPPRRPVDVPGAGPVRHRLAQLVEHRAAVRVARRAQLVGHVLAVGEAHLAELLPRGGLVVPGGDDERVVEVAQALGAADVVAPQGHPVGAQVLAALVAHRAVLLDRPVHPVVDAVLVQLAGQLVRPEDLHVDADLPVARLHPVRVQRLAGVELVRRRVVVLVPVGHLVARDRRPAVLRVAERVGARLLRHEERLVAELEQHHGRAVLRLGTGGRLRRRPLVGPHAVVVVPGHVRLVGPLLRVGRHDRAGGVVGGGVRAGDAGRRGERQRHQGGGARGHEPPGAPGAVRVVAGRAGSCPAGFSRWSSHVRATSWLRSGTARAAVPEANVAAGDGQRLWRLPRPRPHPTCTGPARAPSGDALTSGLGCGRE